MDVPLDYEIGLMNWYGPEQEAQFTDMFQHIFKALGANDKPGSSAALKAAANG